MDDDARPSAVMNRRTRTALPFVLILGLALGGLSACGDSADLPATSGPAADATTGGGLSEGASEVAEPGSSPTSAPSADSGTSSMAGTTRKESGEPTLGPDGQQTDVLVKLEGSSKESCAQVRSARDVRSGSFAAGPFDTARSDWKEGDLEVRLYLIPEHTASMPGVRVTGRNLDDGTTLDQTQTTVADADEFKFYDLELALSTPGTWELKAQAGEDSGCWRLRLG